MTNVKNMVVTQTFYYLPYFLVIRQSFSFLPKQSKNVDPSYKMDLDLWDCLGRVKLPL